MKDPYLESEWTELCDHLRRCAVTISRNADQKSKFLRQAEEFATQAAPDHYHVLLERTAAASKLAVGWQKARAAGFAHDEEMIDEASDESFPASDPPTYSHAHA